MATEKKVDQKTEGVPVTAVDPLEKPGDDKRVKDGTKASETPVERFTDAAAAAAWEAQREREREQGAIRSAEMEVEQENSGG